MSYSVFAIPVLLCQYPLFEGDNVSLISRRLEFDNPNTMLQGVWSPSGDLYDVTEPQFFYRGEPVHFKLSPFFYGVRNIEARVYFLSDRFILLD